jgi:hypothetical protein
MTVHGLIVQSSGAGWDPHGRVARRAVTEMQQLRG